MNDQTPPPYQDDAEYLWDELARVEFLVRARMAAWSQLQAAAGKPAEYWELIHISDEEVTAYLDQGFAAPDRRIDIADGPVAAFREAYLAAGQDIEARQAQTVHISQFRLPHLVAAFGLEPIDLDLLLLTTLPELDPRYRLVYGYLQNDASRALPTVELLIEILQPVASNPGVVLARLAAGAPLRASRLLRVDAEQIAAEAPGRRRVAADERIVRYLLGDDTAGDGPLRALERAPGRAWDGYVAPDDRLNQLNAIGMWCSRRASTGGGVIFLHGARGSGRTTAARVVATSAGIALLQADIATLRAEGEHWSFAVELCYREARLRKAALLWQGADALFNGGEPTQELTQLLDRASSAGVLTFVEAVENWEPTDHSRTPILRLSFPDPDYETRVQVWQHYLPSHEEFAMPVPDSAALVRSLAGAFQLTPGQVVDAVASAHASATVRDPTQGLLTTEDLAGGCRLQSGRRLIQLAQRMEPRPGLNFDDLILARPNRRQLDELRARIALRSRLADTGFERRLPRASGLLVMFTGSSGTGKTMAAELLAQEQGVDLYKIDLAEVVSKYIGETEKNLRRVFREAEDTNAILFFDEADALFGKRGEVLEAKDRWANNEVNFLLQRVEQYAGIVIIATNLRQNIDEAFLRRIHVVVEFPFPDADARLHIWQQLLASTGEIESPAADELRELAERFRIPGGSIRNIVVDAAFRALASGEVPPRITLRHIAASLARDFQKLGKPLTAGEFGAELYDWITEDVLMSVPAGG
ncbi:MAG: ATP-binding protein [Comamonadaceae bacterium]|nr:MAG: ATP-binding protein [Comamonadaceae bacterium]